MQRKMQTFVAKTEWTFIKISTVLQAPAALIALSALELPPKNKHYQRKNNRDSELRIPTKE
jgi:hypothetical protein